MNGNSNGSGGGRFAKRPFNTTSNSNPNPEETIKSRIGNGWQSRIKDNGTTSKSSTNSRFDTNPTTSRNRTDGSTSNPSSRNPLIINGKAKIINNKSYGLGLEISPPIAGLESESDTETSDSERGHQEEEEEEGPPPSVPVKPYPPRLTLTSNSFKGSNKFNLGSGDSSKNGGGGSLLSPLRTGFELQEDDESNDQDQPSTSKSSLSNSSTSPIKSSSSNNGKSSTTKIPQRPPSPEISSPESSFSKRRTAYRSGYTDGGTTDGEGYADEVEIATASVNTVRRVGVGSGPTTSSSSTSNISSTTPNKLKKFTSSTSPSNQHQILPKILASSPSGSYRPLEPIPSSTSLSNLGDDSFPPPNSSPSSTRKISLSAQDSDEDEGINQSKTVSRFTSNKSKSRSSNSRKVSSSISSPMDQNRDENFTSSKDSNPTNQTYDTSTDGSTTTTTVLASIFDESDNNDEEDSSPRETLMIPSSRDSLLRQLAAEQARVEVNTFQYQILSSNELEEYQNELKQLERRSKDVRHKLIVRTRIRDAAIKLRRAHRRTPSQSAANGNSVDKDPSSSSNFRERRNPSISTSGGKSIEDALPQIPPSPAYSTINGLPSPGFGPPPGTPSLGRNRSATFTNVGQAEVEAEASATAASANVDAVAEELLSISERTSELRKKVVEHQAAILAFRVDSLEKERLQESQLKSNKTSGSTSELKNKFKEREKTLIDQINQDRNQLNKIKETERNRREEINELKFRLEDALKERKLDEVRNRKLREELEESQRNGSGKIDDEELKRVEEALNRSRFELKTSKDNERNVSRQKDDLERKVSELERILEGERRSGQDSRHETSRNLTQLQEDLESHKTQLDSSRKQVSESEKKFKELETSHSKDQKLFQERAQLFFAFERNLNDTEERLKEEEKILAQMLGKVDGREEMDDLLSMIKSGGNSSIKKDRLAGQGIQDLLRNVSEHISDLGQELNRLGGLNAKRRTRPSYDEEEENDDSDDDQDLNKNRSIRNQFQDSESTKVDSKLILELEKSKKQMEDSAREREDRLKLEIENLKKESQSKEKENLKALQESKDQLEKLKVEAEKSKKEAAEKSKAINASSSSSPFKTPSPLRSGRDFKDIARITELEKEVEKLKLSNKISSKSTTSSSAGTISSRGISQDNQASEELLEARKVLKELSLMLPPSETLTKINHQVSSSSTTSSPSPPWILDSQLSALALVLQPGGSKALPSLPSNNSEMDYGSSSNNTTAISSSSSTSFTTTSQNHESEYESLPERLRVTLMTARSAALLARDVDANNQRMGKDTAEVVMERETLRAQQEEEHQKLIDRTQTRVKGLESTVKELREALECAHSDLRSLESGSSSRPQTLRSASAGTNGFGKGASPTRYNHRAHISPQPIMIPPNSNSLTPNKIPGGNSWRSQSPGQLSPTSNAMPLLTPSPRKNTFNLPMLSSSPTPSVASNSSSNHQPRTITLGMDTNQLLSKVRELERELDGNKVWKRKGERVDQLERILDETQAQLESSKNELIELKESHEKQKAQFLSEINSLNDELHGAREMLRKPIGSP